METKRFTSADAKALSRNTVCDTDEYKTIIEQVKNVCSTQIGVKSLRLPHRIPDYIIDVLREDGYSVYYDISTVIEWN